MLLKDIVDGLLKAENRPLSWLAGEMNMTFDGLKLSLLKGSLKYNDLKRMAVILKVQPEQFFRAADDQPGKFTMGEELVTYTSLRNELASCKELVDALKSQLKDKEKIIGLLSGSK
jgi:hypothetical protein